MAGSFHCFLLVIRAASGVEHGHSMGQIRAIVVAALSCILLAATHHTFAANAFKTGYLQDYHRLGHVGGVPLEQVWIEPLFDIRDYRVLYIPPVQIDPTAWRHHGEPEHEIAERLGQAYHDELVRQLQG